MKATRSSIDRADLRGGKPWRWLRGWLAVFAIAGWAGGLNARGLAPPTEPFFDKHPNALWRVVHDLCVNDRRFLGLPAPCLAISLREGWAVVKDTGAPTHILLVPTRRLSGIESPELLAPDAHNYWADAWDARRYFEALAHRPVPRDAFGLVINSRFARSQDQLHIHIDCLAPKVARTLSEAAAHVGVAWAPLDERLVGETFEARRIDGEALERNPFKLLATGDPIARADMGAYALAAVGAVFPDGKPGFILLAHRADLQHADRGSGDGLLDHTCRVLRSGSPAGPPASR